MTSSLGAVLKSLLLALPLVLAAEVALAVPDVQVLAVGSNQSYVKTLKDLRFAEADAKRFADAMQTVGLVPSVRATVLTDASVKDFRDAFRQLVAQDKLESKEGNAARKFVFYYSGHSDDRGLHLKDGLISKSELHDELSGLSAHTKVAILDSCFSGAITAKGVEAAPEFELPRVEFDEPSGSVFLTASSGKQFAYESDQLGSSIFTHHLLNGLYGEADGNVDGVVTVDELYQYVYQNTKWQSINYPTKSAQEPEYVAKLQGQGAIVLSFPAKTNSKLALGRDLKGEITIASPRGIQFFKVQKIEGQEKTIQLPVGAYQLAIRDDERIGEGQFKIETGRLAFFGASNVTWRAADQVQTQASKGESSATMEKVAEGPSSPYDGRFGFALGAHSGYYEDSDGMGPFVEVAYSKPFASWRYGELAWGAALNFHRREIRGSYQDEVEKDDQEEALAGSDESSESSTRSGLIDPPETRTDSTGGFLTVAASLKTQWPFSSRLGFEGGFGQTYHDQEVDYGEIQQGGTAPGWFSGLRLDFSDGNGPRYGLIYREEFIQTTDVSDSASSARGKVFALSAMF